MRQYLIDKTQRESLVYSLLIELKYNTAKLANTKNRLFRNRKISNYLLSHPVRKIHFGAGSGKYGEASTTQLSGFLNTDILGETPIDISKPLPFADQSIDIIFSSHLIEHIYHRHFKRFLAESFRILKSGGQQIIATPSLEKLCRALYGENDSIKRTIYETHLGKIMGKSGVRHPPHVPVQAFVLEPSGSSGGNGIGFRLSARNGHAQRLHHSCPAGTN